MSELEKFIKTIRLAESDGKIRFSKDLSDYDLMVQFAIGKLGEKRGYPLNASHEEIIEECKTLGDYAIKLLEEKE